MKKLARNAAALAVLAALFLSLPACAGQLEDGQDAYARGDYPAALKLWQPLAEQGDTRAEFRLGWMYWYGDGVRPDPVESLKWYRKAAEQGDANAQFNLGMMYWWGMGKLPKDYTESARWYRKAAEQGDAKAQLSLGKMYEHGAGVEQDFVQAYMWVSVAKATNNKISATALDSIAAKMTPTQLAEAKRRAEAWRQPSPQKH